jgi:protein-tyrosine phosphatase
MAARFRVLFVCVGNVCRSPLGERLLRMKLPADRFEITSAGVNALEGAPISVETVVELEARGGDASGFVARRLDEDMLHEADLILVATRDLRSRVLSETPSALRRTFTVREFAALLDEIDADDVHELVARAAEVRSRARLTDYDIPDPYQRGPVAQAEAARLVADAVDRIAKGLDR